MGSGTINTNWYSLSKTMMKTSFRNENDILATRIGNYIFEKIKADISADYFEDREEEGICAVKYNVRHINETTQLDGHLKVSAHLFASKNDVFEPSISLDVLLYVGFSQNDFKILLDKVINAMCHEIEHYRDYEKKTFEEYDEAIIRINYLTQCQEMRSRILSNQEIVPYIRGLVLIAKRDKKPFPVIVDEDLDRVFFENDKDFRTKVIAANISAEVAEIILDIKTKVIAKALTIFPNLRLT